MEGGNVSKARAAKGASEARRGTSDEGTNEIPVG